MGFFSNSTTYVSSVVYNLAGDENKRPDFLKSIVINSVIGTSSNSIGDDIQSSYINGPGITLRNFTGWCDTSGYNDMIGLTTGTIAAGDSLDNNALALQIPHAAGETVVIQSSEIGNADYNWWAEGFMLKMYPDLFTTAWSADFDENTGLITVTFADTTTTSFTPDNWDANARFLYSMFIITTGAVPGVVVPGVPVPLGSSDPFPSTSGWTVDSRSEVPTDLPLLTTVDTVVSYSDGRPDETSHTESTDTDSYVAIADVFEKTVYGGSRAGPNNSKQTFSTKSIMYQDQTGAAVAGEPTVETSTAVVGGVTVTTKKTTVAETKVLTRSYQVDTQDIVTGTSSTAEVFIYKQNDGNATLDAMFALPSDLGQFYPYIPFRLDNKFISADYKPDLYNLSVKAFKKAIGGKYDKTLASIADNPSLGDLDYVYAVFGVSLNVQEVKCRKYIYLFLQALVDAATSDPAAYNAWQTAMAAADAAQTVLNTWSEAQNNPDDPLFGTPQPPYVAYPPAPTQSVQIQSTGANALNFNISMQWNAMATATGYGIKDVAHQKGDLWFVQNATETYNQTILNGNSTDLSRLISISNITLYWQVDDNNWKSITVWGWNHKNMVYGGKSVDISATDALNDTNESGFIVPLHEGIYKSMSLVDSTQMSTACCFLLFNCYQVVKKKWYQTGIFQIIVVIIIIVITIFTAGAGAGLGAGLLGTDAAVGAAIGLSGLAAIVVGAVANAIAAMILLKLVSYGATLIFGDKLGPVIGAIASVVAVAVGGSISTGGSLADGFSSLTDAGNLLKLTEAAGSGYAGYVEAATKDIVAQTQAMMNDYNTQEKAVSEAYAQNIGTDLGIIDPSQLTDSASSSNYIYETSDSFLSRTLMAGSDIVDLSQQLLYNFTALTLNVDVSTLNS